MIIFNKDTERNNGRKDRAQDVRIDSLQTAVDELNADIAEIEITVENLSQSIDDKYAAQTQTLMSELNSRIQSLISNLEDFVNTAQVNADVGNFKNLYATVLSNLKNLTVDLVSVTGSASIAAAAITSEEVTSSQIQTLQATTATISELTVTLLHLANISAANITAEKVSADEVETDLLKADEARTDVVKAKNITGKGWQTPIGTPDNTELLKITIPHYEGVIQIQTEDDEFNVSIFNNALVSWTEKADYLFRIQRSGTATELYLQNIGDTIDYRLLFIGSEDTVTPTSEIVDKTGIRQNVLTLNGIHGAFEGGSGSGSQIVFVDTLPAVGEEGIIYVSATVGAWVWKEETRELIPLAGSDLLTQVSDNTTHIGTVANLTTTEKTNLVGAINEVNSDVGDLASLTTTAQTDLVSAINEVDDHADTNASNISTIIGNDTGMSMREVAQDVSANVYIPCGSVLFANLPALSGLRVGDVYNIEDDFTTTADFIEGAGHVVKAGSNIVVIDSNNVKKWDVLGLGVDTSSFMTKADPTGTGSFSLNRKANTTVGVNSVAEGINCEASGSYSHAEGGLTRASDAGAHAEGDNTVASAFCAHAEGNNSQATSFDAHAEGYSTEARGFCSHTEGWKSKATEQHSHAEGCFTLAGSESQHVQGKYNIADSNDTYADIVGGGSADNHRKNIEATTWTGDKRLKGTVYINCNDDSTGGVPLEALSHNIPRLYPKDITSYYTDGTLWKRLNGTDGFSKYEDIYAGDYFQMSRAITCPDSYQGAVGSDWVTIGGIDTLMGNGDQNVVNYHHLVMIPGKGEEGLQYFGRHAMNATNTTEGGYKASEMNTLILGDVVSAGSTASGATINHQLYAEFGSHLKTTRELISNSLNASGYNRLGSASGCSSDWAWINCQAVLMSEVEVYGSIVWSSSGYDTGNAKVQLPLFRFSTAALNNRSAYWWLKDVASAAYFCYVASVGSVACGNAGNAGAYVRPRFVLA